MRPIDQAAVPIGSRSRTRTRPPRRASWNGDRLWTISPSRRRQAIYSQMDGRCDARQGDHAELLALSRHFSADSRTGFILGAQVDMTEMDDRQREIAAKYWDIFNTETADNAPQFQALAEQYGLELQEL